MFMKQSLESIKLEFIQEVMSEQSYDTLKEWLYMNAGGDGSEFLLRGWDMCRTDLQSGK